MASLDETNSPLAKSLALSLTVDELEAVRVKLADVLGEAQVWHERHPVLPDVAMLPIAAISIAHDPDATPVEHGLRIAMACWTIAIDDLLDSPPPSVGPAKWLGIGADERAAVRTQAQSVIAECCRNCALHPAASAVSNPYSDALHGFHTVLYGSSPWGMLGGVWSRLFAAFMRASLYEFDLSSRLLAEPSTRLPTLDSYLRYGRHSIALPWLLVSILTSGHEKVPAGIVAPLVSLVMQCGTVMRLANDLATYRREAGEHSINAVAILAAARSNQESSSGDQSSYAESEAKIRWRLDREMIKAVEKAEGLHPLTPVATGILRYTEIGVAMYACRDLRAY